MSRDLVAAALAYAERGWPTFPCHWLDGTACSCGDADCGSPGKHPLTVRGVKNAATSADQIRTWWARWPRARVAIATGAPGPDVVDFDVAAGKPGRRSYVRLGSAGLLTGPAILVGTPSGGRHAYFVGSTQANGSMPRHGVDFRGVGGYVIAPPSPGYQVLAADPHTTAGVDFGAIRKLLDPPRPAPARQRSGEASGSVDALIRHVAGLTEGNRNAGLYWASCRAVEEGAGEGVFAALIDAAVSVGLSEHAARRTVESARRRLTGVGR